MSTIQTQQDGDKVANYLTMLGHTCSDINQGAISATLPFLIMHDGYSYTAVTMLVFAANIASAVIQPLFGIIGDKHPCPWFMALGVFLAGLGMTGIGFMDSYWLVLLSAMVSGIGIAMFHPEGGRLANLAAGTRKAGGMSIFAVGGNVGFFIGPILAAASLGAFGMHGTIVFIFPATICAIILLCNLKRFRALGTTSKVAGNAEDLPAEHWDKFALQMSVLSLRSIVNYGLLAFIPLFFVGVLGQAETTGSIALSVFAITGAFGTAMSGRASERFGSRKLTIACLLITAVFVVVFALNQSVVAAFVFAALLAIASDLFYPSAVAQGMSYVPRHLGTASGISYGIAVCIGGVAEPFLGMAGDAYGLVPVMFIIAVITVVAAALALVVLKRDAKDGVREY